MTDVQGRLFALRDEGYARFQCALMPTVAPETVIGVRVPLLRKLAAQIDKTPEAEAFLGRLPHDYYEENCLHAFLIERIRDADACYEAVDKFLPFVDNWATCDMMSPKALVKQPERLFKSIDRWLASGHTYTVRFGLVMLMKHFLTARFTPEILLRAERVRAEDYYVRMAVAWLFATALTHQYEAALPFLEEKRLECWTHNKAIQKAIESWLIPEDRKAYLKTLKEKKTDAP